MPLVFTGQTGNSEQFELLLEAYDGDRRVVVVSSREAMEDHGIGAIHDKASEKYDAGRLDADGRVKVLTSDF